MGEAPSTPPTHARTAWHPLFLFLLEHFLPDEHWQVLGEFSLSREPRRIDAVVVRRRDDAPPWHPAYLRSVLDHLRPHNLVHFKGATDALERADATQLLSYAFQYMAHCDLETRDAVALRVVAPTLTPRFRTQLDALGGDLAETPLRGVHEGSLGGFTLRVVETTLAWSQPGEHLLYSVSPACITHPRCPDPLDDTELSLYYRLLRNVAQLAKDATWKAIMKDANLVETSAGQALLELLASIPAELRLQGLAPDVRLQGLAPDDVVTRFKPDDILARFAPEQRLAGLAPEQRLAGLAPEQRLAGLAPATIAHALSPEDRLLDLTPAQAVLALPDALLRGLSADFIATLPDDVQRTVRERLAR